MAFHGFDFFTPTKCGALRGIVSLVILFFLPNVAIKSSNSWVAKACRNSNSPLVPMKVVELPLYVSSGIPRRDTNILMAARQSSLVRDNIWLYVSCLHTEANGNCKVCFQNCSSSIFCVERSTIIESAVTERK